MNKLQTLPLPIKIFDEIDSTNLEARRIAEEGDFQEQILLARAQTGGRGRLGRSFFSPNGGLYLSFLLKPHMSPSDAIRLTTAAAVATAQAIDDLCGRESGIKWVNDIYLDGKKICGILTEARFDALAMQYAVVGIGVNIEAPENGFPADIADRAGALFPFGKAPHDAFEQLGYFIASEFLALYEKGLPMDEILPTYRRRSVVLGREIEVFRAVGGEGRRAIAESIDDLCRLLVRYEDGTCEALGTGEISIKL